MKRAFSFGEKSIEATVRRVNEVRRIAIIGAGTMGRGIAVDVLRKTDCAVTLLDVAQEALDRTRGRLGELWAGEVRGQRLRPEDARWYGAGFPLDGDQRFELVNFIDGARTVSEIRDALAAEYGPVALSVVAYNFARAHSTIRVSPAVEAGLTDHVWSVEELIAAALAARGPDNDDGDDAGLALAPDVAPPRTVGHLAVYQGGR